MESEGMTAAPIIQGEEAIKCKCGRDINELISLSMDLKIGNQSEFHVKVGVCYPCAQEIRRRIIWNGLAALLLGEDPAEPPPSQLTKPNGTGVLIDTLTRQLSDPAPGLLSTSPPPAQEALAKQLWQWEYTEPWESVPDEQINKGMMRARAKFLLALAVEPSTPKPKAQ
jgi:hypothetical protein